MHDLSNFTNEELRAELAARERAASEAYWRRRIAEAKYLCHGCGYPDGWHSQTCPTDTEE